MKRLYVGNLAYHHYRRRGRAAFSGSARCLRIPRGGSRRARSFGYVEMEDGDNAAIGGLNRTDPEGTR